MQNSRSLLISVPQKILFLQSTSEIGGSDISLLRIVGHLDKRVYEPIVGLPQDGPLVEKLKQAGSGVVIFPEMMKLTSRKNVFYPLFYLVNYPWAVFRIAAWIRKNGIALVHTNTLHNLYGFASARLAGRPHVWHVREIVLQSRVMLQIERRLALHFSDRIVVTSDAVAENFLPDIRHRRKVTKISNGVDLREFRPGLDGSRILHDLGFPKGAPLIGLVARLDHWKGVETFLEAAALAAQKNPAARYLIAGGPVPGREDYARQMKQRARDLNLDGRVQFTDWRYGPKVMPEVYAALDVLVLASSWPEPFGLTVIEAMASAKPVIVTNHGGPQEICIHDHTGLLVTPKNPQAMADAMTELMEDPGKRKTMGQAGRKRAEALYDERDCAKKIEAVYRDLLKEKSF